MRRGFERFMYWFCHRLFADVYVANAAGLSLRQGVAADRPLICYANHPSYWDPVVAVLLGSTCFWDRQFFAPMDDQAMRRYAMLRPFGFFPVARDSVAGVRHFLRDVAHVLAYPDSVLFITPQNDIVPQDRRPPGFTDGLRTIANRYPAAQLLPVAIHYQSIGKKQQVLVQFGVPPLRDSQGKVSTQDLESALVTAQDALRDVAQLGKLPHGFAPLLRPSRPYGFLEMLRDCITNRDLTDLQKR